MRVCMSLGGGRGVSRIWVCECVRDFGCVFAMLGVSMIWVGDCVHDFWVCGRDLGFMCVHDLGL